ncbi:MAG: tyrosine-type recombinase/integrase [Alistipes sp.]|nr:tyrosine-type recombinase/integrase [Alistipes sp.]
MSKNLIYRCKVRLCSRLNKKGEARIIIRLSFNAERINLETGYTIDPDKWDKDIEKVLRNCTNSQGLTFSDINDGIANGLYVVNNIFKKYELSGEGYPTKEQVKEEFYIATQRKEKVVKTLLEYYDEFMNNRSILNSWSENNKKKFLAVRNKFKEYNESLQIEELSEANLVMIAKFFQKYWKNNSTFIKRWQDIRAFFRWCDDNNYPIHKDWKRFQIKQKTAKRFIVYLEADELLRIYNHNFSKENSHLALYRDWLCFGAFTSLRFSDIGRLEKKDVRDDYFEITTKKDSDPVKIELNKYSRAIIDRYRKSPFAKKKVLPPVHNAVLNKYLKDIGEICEVNTIITKTHYEGTKRIEESKPKYEFITSHTGRKTFICLALSMGIPPTTVMAWSGHESYEDMKPYIRITDQAKADAMAKFDTLEQQTLTPLEEIE